MKIEVLQYKVPYITSCAEFSEESISGIINSKSTSVWPIFSIFSPDDKVVLKKQISAAKNLLKVSKMRLYFQFNVL